MERPGGAADGVDEHARVRLRRGPRPAHEHAKERARRGAQRSAAASRPRVHERGFLQLTLPSLPRRSSDRTPAPRAARGRGEGQGEEQGTLGQRWGERCLVARAARGGRRRVAVRLGPAQSQRGGDSRLSPCPCTSRGARRGPHHLPPPARTRLPACAVARPWSLTHGAPPSTAFGYFSKPLPSSSHARQITAQNASISQGEALRWKPFTRPFLFFFFCRAVRRAAPDRVVADRAAPRAGENSFPKNSE